MPLLAVLILLAALVGTFAVYVAVASTEPQVRTEACMAVVACVILIFVLVRYT